MAVVALAKHSHIVSLELQLSDAADQLASSTGESSTTSSTYQNKISHTWTPDSTGDYLLFLMAQIKAPVPRRIEVQIDIDGTVRSHLQHEPRNTTDYTPWCTVLGCIGTAGTDSVQGEFDNTEHTVKIQYKSTDNLSTVFIKEARLLILRLDTFPNFYYAEALSRQFTTSTSYVTKLTNGPDILTSGDHLVFAAASIDGTSGSGRFTNGRIVSKAGVTNVELKVFPTSTAGLDDYSMGLFRVETLVKTPGGDSDNIWTMAIKKGGTGTGGVGIEHAAICVIELESAAPVTQTWATLGRTAITDRVAVA